MSDDDQWWRGSAWSEDSIEKEWFEIDDVLCIAETPKAILCRFVDDREHWIPLSQVSVKSEVQEMGDEGTLIISEWLAEKKGLAD